MMPILLYLLKKLRAGHDNSIRDPGRLDEKRLGNPDLLLLVLTCGAASPLRRRGAARQGARYRMKATRREPRRSSCASRWSPGPYSEHDADTDVSSSPVTALIWGPANVTGQQLRDPLFMYQQFYYSDAKIHILFHSKVQFIYSITGGVDFTMFIILLFQSCGRRSEATDKCLYADVLKNVLVLLFRFSGRQLEATDRRLYPDILNQ